MNFPNPTFPDETSRFADSIWLKGATTFLSPNSIKVKDKDKDHPYAATYGVSEIVTELSIREYLLRRQILKLEDIHEMEIIPADIKRVTVTETVDTKAKKP